MKALIGAFSVIVKLRVIFGNIRFKLCWKVLSQRYRYKGDTKSWRWPHIKSLHTWQLTMQNASVQRPSCRSCKCFNVVHLQTNTAHTIYYELRIIGQQCRRWSWSRVTNKWKLNVHFRTRFSVVISPIKRWLITYYLFHKFIHPDFEFMSSKVDRFKPETRFLLIFRGPIKELLLPPCSACDPSEPSESLGRNLQLECGMRSSVYFCEFTFIRSRILGLGSAHCCDGW